MKLTDATRSGKSKMAACKLEILISQLASDSLAIYGTLNIFVLYCTQDGYENPMAITIICVFGVQLSNGSDDKVV